jgi:hypothetical protein
MESASVDMDEKLRSLEERFIALARGANIRDLHALLLVIDRIQSEIADRLKREERQEPLSDLCGPAVSP